MRRKIIVSFIVLLLGIGSYAIYVATIKHKQSSEDAQPSAESVEITYTEELPEGVDTEKEAVPVIKKEGTGKKLQAVGEEVPPAEVQRKPTKVRDKVKEAERATEGKTIPKKADVAGTKKDTGRVPPPVKITRPPVKPAPVPVNGIKASEEATSVKKAGKTTVPTHEKQAEVPESFEAKKESVIEVKAAPSLEESQAVVVAEIPSVKEAEKKMTEPVKEEAAKPVIKPAPAPLEGALIVQEKTAGDILEDRTGQSLEMAEADLKERSGKVEEKKEIVAATEKKEEVSGSEEPDKGPVTIHAKPPPEASENVIAILPFENLSDNKDALRYILPALVDRLEEKGFSSVDEDSLENFLCEQRVRATGYVSKDLALKIREKFNAGYILAGSIISFSEGENPKFGILSRLIDSSDSSIIWADYAAATGEDFVTILGLGKLKSVFSLIPKVMDALFKSFRVEDFYRETPFSHKVAVMPFKNNSDYHNAGIITMYMFITELLKNQEFQPIEYGNIRNLIISLRIRNRGELNYNNITALSEALGASGIIVGVVDNYSNGTDVSSPPMVGITARLVDGRSNKILWYNSHQLDGEENLIALDWGRIRSVHAVAYQVVSDLVTDMGATKWQ